jgi:hypothetical protein
MSKETLLGSWDELVVRLDAAGAPARWAAEPALAGLASVQQLKDWTQEGDAARSDAILGALVRHAAAVGRRDQDASMVLLHLLWPGIVRVSIHLQSFARTLGDVPMLVIGELAVQIAQFPVERRHRAYAANLLRDTQRALLRELRPYHPENGELFIDAVTAAARLPATERWNDDQDLDLVDMLMWACRTGIVEDRDLAVMIELEFAREVTETVVRDVARGRGCAVRSVQRGRDRALAALRAHRETYLAGRPAPRVAGGPDPDAARRALAAGRGIRWVMDVYGLNYSTVKALRIGDSAA